MTIHDWLDQSVALLQKNDVSSARLDAEIILAHTLRRSRTWLHMYRDKPIDDRLREIADARIDLRCDHTPIAYIVGHKEFYGRSFAVTPSVLVPSPETEALIELALSLDLPRQTRAIDVGTGSGVLGITLALERSFDSMILSDISERALTVAQKNVDALHPNNVALQRSDLLHFWEPLNQSKPIFDLVVANLPYVDPSWQRNQETHHEPAEALFADDGGLSLINQLIDQSARALNSGGYLLLEADPRQHAAITHTATRSGFRLASTLGYGILFTK